MTRPIAIRIQKDNKFRFWISLIVFVICSLLTGPSSPNRLISVVALFLAYNLTIGIIQLAARVKGSILFHYFLLALDATSITATVHLTGGFQSPLYVLYLVLFGLCIYHESLANFVYSAVLSACLYIGLIFYTSSITREFLFAASAQLIVMSVLTAVLYSVLVYLKRQKYANERLISRAKTAAHIADVLSGTIENSRDWVKTISRMINDEVKADGLSCRIVIHKGEQVFLPPSHGKVCLQLPIMVGEFIFGTCVVTRQSRIALTASEQDFFSSAMRSLGVSLHRARLWEDFQKQLQKVEASMLLETPPKKMVGGMIDLVGYESGQWKLKKDPTSIEMLVKNTLERIQPQLRKGVDIDVIGALHAIPAIEVDGEKLRKCLANMVLGAIESDTALTKIWVEVVTTDTELLLSVRDHSERSKFIPDTIENYYGEALVSQPAKGKTNVDLLICKKIIEAHEGKFWVERLSHQPGISLNFSIPLNFILPKREFSNPQ